MTILFFGDIVGKTGRRALAKVLPQLRARHKPDLILANAENAAHGKGLTSATYGDLQDAGVDFFTGGNHIFSKPEAAEVFGKFPDKLVRPANVPDALPGKGWAVITVQGHQVAVLNLLGQVFMEKQFDFGQVSNPFTKLNELLEENALAAANIKILDFHAEATSEKRAMGFWADGRLSAVIGTHTHIPTADAQILPQGTGYLTDLGMVGAADSVIGVAKDKAVSRLLAESAGGEKVFLEVAESDQFEVGYAVLEIDEHTGKCQNISSFRILDQADAQRS